MKMGESFNQFDYFYENEADQFVFYRIPKKLFTEKAFDEISCEAKVLYGLMLDRLSLSCKNRWIDKEGRVYIAYSRLEAAEELGCGEKKVGRLIGELAESGLIRKRRRGQGKSNVFYVMNFNRPEEMYVPMQKAVPDEEFGLFQKGQNDRSRKAGMADQPQKGQNDRSRKAGMADQPQKGQNDRSRKAGMADQPQKGQNDCLRKAEMTALEGSEWPPNNTYINKTDITSIIHPSIYPSKRIKADVCRQIDYAALINDMPVKVAEIDEIAEMIAEIMALPPDTLVKIGGIQMSSCEVQEHFSMLNMFHIRYVLNGIDEASRSSRIKNIKAYMLTALFNATMTMSNHYSAQVNYDMHSEEGG